MGTDKTNDISDNAAITAAAVAGSNAVANGGGDIAVYEARKAELTAIRERAVTLAAIDRDSAVKKSAVWGGKRGQTMADNARRDYQQAVKDAASSFHNALDTFAVTGGFLSLVGNDQALAILGRRAEAIRESFATVFETARAAGIESLATPTGRAYNVAEMIALLSSSVTLPTAEAEGTESTEKVAA